MCAHLSRSCSSLSIQDQFHGEFPVGFVFVSLYLPVPISRQVRRAVSEERGIRFLRLSAGRNVLLPLPSLLRMELLLVAAVGGLLREDGPSGRAGCARKHFLKPTIDQHFVSSVLRIALRPLFESPHPTSQAFAMRFSRSSQCLCHPPQSGDFPLALSHIFYALLCLLSGAFP